MSQRTALLLGGNGLIGSQCLKFLLDDPLYKKVVTPVRQKMAVSHDSLVQIQINFDRIEDHKDELECDDVFCCLGTTIKKAGSQEEFRKVDLTYPDRFARVAVEKGASQFLLVSAVGADSGSSIFYNRIKGEVEEAIGHYDFDTFHIFHPSLLLGKRQESRPGENFAARPGMSSTSSPRSSNWPVPPCSWRSSSRSLAFSIR